MRKMREYGCSYPHSATRTPPRRGGAVAEAVADTRGVFADQMLPQQIPTPRSQVTLIVGSSWVHHDLEDLPWQRLHPPPRFEYQPTVDGITDAMLHAPSSSLALEAPDDRPRGSRSVADSLHHVAQG